MRSFVRLQAGPDVCSLQSPALPSVSSSGSALWTPVFSMMEFDYSPGCAVHCFLANAAMEAMAMAIGEGRRCFRHKKANLQGWLWFAVSGIGWHGIRKARLEKGTEISIQSIDL